MKIKLLSDLHLESDSTNYLPPKTPDDKDIVLILAGDICEIDKINKLMNFLGSMSNQYRHVIYVLGNHEFYCGHLSNSLSKITNKVTDFPNVTVLENKSLTIDGIKFIGATLWTDVNGGDPLDQWTIGQKMNDYRYIRIGDYRKIKTVDTISKHLQSVRYIREELLDKSGTNVVITHHAPSLLSIHPQYVGNDVNYGYVSDLSELILDCGPTYWFHGHAHNSFDYMIGNTRVICNPKGYSFTQNYIENLMFNDDMVLEID